MFDHKRTTNNQNARLIFTKMFDFTIKIDFKINIEKMKKDFCFSYRVVAKLSLQNIKHSLITIQK